MFYISEDELKFKKDTVFEYRDLKLNQICIRELVLLNERYPIDDFVSFSRRYFQYFLNRTYLDDIVVFFEDGSILKVHFSDSGFECSEYYDNEISTAFYYGRYSIRLF